MLINTIYLTYQGEINIHGIGAPVIFVRTGGCHLRCYKKTLGVLCDTPEALSKTSDEYTDLDTASIVTRVRDISDNTGVKLVCLTGGDPLWRKPIELHDLFRELAKYGFDVSVETSGTVSIREWRYSNVHWVLDYKLKSAGVKADFIFPDLPYLKQTDFIKFVIYDHEDYNEFRDKISYVQKHTFATISVGCYWGGKMTYQELVRRLMDDRIFGQVTINFQSHKLATLLDNSDVSSLSIPKNL